MQALEMKFLSSYAPHILSALRIVAAGSFFTHGTMKLLSWPAPFEFPMTPLLYAAGIIEVVGGVLVMIGLFTRPAAFIMSGTMAFAYFMVHSSGGFFPVLNHGEAAMLFCFVFLYFAAAGPGTISVDEVMARRAPEPVTT